MVDVSTVSNGVANIAGSVDIGTCAQIVSKTFMDNIVPIASAAAIFGVLFLISWILYIYSARDKKMLQDFLRRKKLLNEYEDWLKDRSIPNKW